MKIYLLNIISLKRENKLITIFFFNRNKHIWGGRQAELLVAQQAHALQTDEHKALPPAELQALVRELLTCSPYYAEAVRKIINYFHKIYW